MKRRVDVVPVADEVFGPAGGVDEAVVDAGEAPFSVVEVFMSPFHWPTVKLLRSRL
jgi:hypothetical protein